MKPFTINELYKVFCQHPTITTDSRVCPKGSLFFALKGDSFNGNKFALMALEKGCQYAIVDEQEQALDNRFILVDNVLTTLQQLATLHRKALGTPIIGITGTNGKTTTKELVSAVLSEKYQVLFTQGNFNNHIGVPLTLLKLTKEHDIAVIEMGANHPGEIKTLVNIACPDCGLITNVGKAHLEGFGSLEGVLHTKGELYDYLREHDGHVFINSNNELLKSIAHKLNTTTYAIDGEADIQGSVTACSPFVSIKWCKKGEAPQSVNTHFVGIYNAENMLAAVTIGLHYEISLQAICHALETYVPQNNRSQFIETAHNRVVVDAYNANPTSMMAALENFEAMQMPAKGVILGDMLELGSQSADEHRHIVDYLKTAHLECVYLVGKQFAAVADQFQSFENTAALITYLEQKPLENKTLLVKGSNGIGLTKVLPLL